MEEAKPAEIDKKYRHYLSLTTKALEKSKIAVPKNSHLYDAAKNFREMAKCYCDDSQHFFKNNDKLTALCAASYAHAWLDCGARLGLFDVGEDHQLFTLKD
ncbi:MAG: DUF357 domain-containing protein [Candidatus Diapherotrites archaeon]|nr:DUF357 domain-containing protein [Candidatus Diapherotrites archaeon]